MLFNIRKKKRTKECSRSESKGERRRDARGNYVKPNATQEELKKACDISSSSCWSEIYSHLRMHANVKFTNPQTQASRACYYQTYESLWMRLLCVFNQELAVLISIVTWPPPFSSLSREHFHAMHLFSALSGSWRVRAIDPECISIVQPENTQHFSENRPDFHFNTWA